MLGLGQQIRCHIPGIGRVVGDDQDLAGAGDGVDAHVAVDSFLCQRHIDVARAHDLVNLGDGLCAVSQCGNGLGAAHLVDHIGACLFGSHQCGGVYLTVFSRRCGHNDLLHPCHLGRNNVHEHGRRINGLAAGYIDAHPAQRRDLLAQHGAVGLGVKPAVAALFLMIGADIHQRLTDDLHQRRIHRFIGFCDLLLCDNQIVGADIGTVKFLRIFE